MNQVQQEHAHLDAARRDLLATLKIAAGADLTCASGLKSLKNMGWPPRNTRYTRYTRWNSARLSPGATVSSMIAS